MVRGLFVLLGCAGVAAAPVTAKASEAAAPVDEGASVEAGAGGAGGESTATSEPAVAAAPVTVTTRSPAVEVFTAKKVRHDWYVGAGFGLGAGNFQAGAGRRRR